LGPAGVALRLLFVAALAAVLAALWVQDHSGALPLGLFNAGRGAYAALSAACAVGAGLVLSVFVAELALGRPLALAGVLRGLLVSLVIVEILLFAADVTLLSRGGARFGGPYREVRGADGEWVTLKKPHGGSPLGFRTAVPYEKVPEAPRVLFLGDSYTEGSGRSSACNYPEVAGATLAEALDRPVEVMNAGVAGAGPADAARVLRLLVARGYRFDAVVYGLFLENDFTDVLPGTERRVIAGINDRVPESLFLRLFHPLNWRLFRFAVFVKRTSRFVRGDAAAVRREEGECDLVPHPLESLEPPLRDLVVRRLEANYGPASRLAEGEVERGIAAMRETAAARGVPFAVVVFPDRVRVDAALRERLAASGVDLSRYDLGRLRGFVQEHFPRLPVIEVAPALRAGSENYRPEDTHLSDLGNLRAGRRVGRALARWLPEAGFASDAGEGRGPEVAREPAAPAR
jgi:hypothetical protein